MKAGRYPQREVRLIVIHCSAGRCNASCYPEKPEGCHFFVKCDGRIDRLRDIGQPGQHTAGFDLHSIGIYCQSPANDDGAEANACTLWQKNALDDLLWALHTCFPSARIMEHEHLMGNLSGRRAGFDVELPDGATLISDALSARFLQKRISSG